MPERFLGGRVVLHAGDCRAVLAELAENSIDSVVCDPPYHLTSIVQRFGGANAAPAQFGSDGRYARASAGFMGKQWDGGDIAFDPQTWRAVIRVLKPGGYLLAMGGTRTYHRLACAIEDAGFDVRDLIAWCYGSGFPKWHDVSKGIDRRRTEDEVPVRVICRFIRAAMDARGLKSHELVGHFDNCHPRLIDHWAARDTDSQPSLPTWAQWLTLKQVLGLSDDCDAEVARLNERKGEPSDDWKNADVLGEYHGVPGGFGDHRFTFRDKAIRAPTDAARQWEGWGTALKPALEPICMARKPLSEGTVAANVLRWGTGAINVDGCRVEGMKDVPGSPRRAPQHATYGDLSNDPGTGSGWDKTIGRWPANVVHDGSAEVLAAFPESSASTASANRNGKDIGDVNGGSAARFFYTAKADADDRLGSKHPTVKPVDLMQWLVRLVTPEGGTVLDPFAGTGTTGEAAFRELMSAVLIEAEPEYQADIRRRMALVLAGPLERTIAGVKARGLPDELGPLFTWEAARNEEAAE